MLALALSRVTLHCSTARIGSWPHLPLIIDTTAKFIEFLDLNFIATIIFRRFSLRSLLKTIKILERSVQVYKVMLEKVWLS